MNLDPNKIPTRDEVPIEYTRNLEALFASQELWHKSLENTKASLDTLKVYQGILAVSSKHLYECLTLRDSISCDVERLYVYANMRLHEDGSNSGYQALADLAQSLLTDFSKEASFIEPEILAISENHLNEFIEENSKLSLYKHYLNNLLAKKDHVLDSETERILSQVSEIGNSPADIFAMFNNADIKFPSIKAEDGKTTKVTHGRYIQFLESTNRDVRRDAFHSVYGTYNSFKNMLAATFSGNIKQFAFFSDIRNYKSPLESSLSKNHVPLNVYDNLITSVNDNLDLMHRYIDLRAKLLGLDKLHMYDLYTPMIKEVSKTITYDEAWATLLDALTPLGEEYSSLLKEARANRWIDVYENQGKRSGAYSWDAYGTHPYVLLNHSDNLSSMFTLAHEMGHAIHSHYSNSNQPYIYANYTIFVAEVASTVNESLLMHFLLENAKDENEKAYLLNYFLEQFRGTIYRQTMFAEFEKLIHEKYEKTKSLTVDSISEIYYDLSKKYHGDHMIIDKEISMEWARIPHFYTPFYVYQYATGFSAAIAISQRILKEGKPAVKDYIEFLKGGSSKHPIDLLKIAGVDMSSPKPIAQALKVFEELIDELDSLTS